MDCYQKTCQPQSKHQSHLVLKVFSHSLSRKEKKYSGRVGEVAFIMKKSINCKLSFQPPANRTCKLVHNQQNDNTCSENQVPQPKDGDSSYGDVYSKHNEEVQRLGKGREQQQNAKSDI